MSALGVNSNFSGSESKKVPRNMNGDIDGYTDPRRTGHAQGKKKNKWNNSNKHNNNGTNGSNSFENSNTTKDKASRKYKQEESPYSDEPLDIPTKTITRKAPEKLQEYSSTDIQLTGPLFSDPEMLGFQNSAQKQRQNRPVPKYLIHQSRLLYTPPFRPNAWDKQNQEKMLQMEQSNSGNDYQGIYEEFQKLREVERKKMEELGLVDAENIRKDLNDAISFQGSCEDMCPIFERVRRSLENNVKSLEKDPATNKISRERAIKAFSRPAAGQPPPLPSEVRPPHVLQKTLDYMVENIIGLLPESHSFVWDRTRSIRQDFTYQNSFGPEAIDCNERIVRIHLLSLHVMAKSGQEYSQQQELEQFNKALQTLIEIYQDFRNHGGGDSPNEAEFRSYYLLSHLRNPEPEIELQRLPNHLFRDPQIQLALKLRNIISQNNLIERGGIKNSPGAINLFVEFFRLVYSNETPFLMSCLLETHFNEIRFYALKSMSRSYHTKGKPYSAENLKNLLGFDTIDSCVKFVTYYEVDIIEENGEILVDLFNKDKLESKYKLNSIHEKPKLSQPTSQYIDQKTIGKNFKDFINSGKPNLNVKVKTAADVVLPLNPSTKTNISSSSRSSQPFMFGSTKTSSDKGMFGQSSIKPLQNPPSTGFGQAPPSNNFGPDKIPVSTGFAQSSSPILTQHNNGASTGNGSGGFAGFNTEFGKLPVNPTNINSQNSNKPPGPFKFDPAPKASIPKEQTDTTSNLSGSKLFSSSPSGSHGSPAPTIMFPKAKDVRDSQPTIPGSFQPDSSQQKIPVAEPKPLPPKQKKLTESPKYAQAMNELIDQLMKNCIETELSSLLPKLIRFQNLKQERKSVINSLSNELYSAFLSEIIHKKSMEAYADHIYQQKLKKSIMHKIKQTSMKCVQKQLVKKKKIEELNSISFKVPKRRLSSVGGSANSSFTSFKRRNVATSSISGGSIEERQSEIKKLWSPLDLEKFISGCSDNLKVPIESKQLEVSFLLVVENWTSSYSKWLNTKLSLKTNVEQRIYENRLVDEKLIIDFKSLPANNYLTKEFFSTTSFVLFECGFTDSDTLKFNGNVQQKLSKDGQTLKKIISLINKFSYFKVQILVVFWDVTGAKLTFEQVCEILKLQTLSETSENIENIILCDMTSEDDNIHDIFTNGFNKLRENFSGKLSKRGLKKQAKAEKLEATNKKSEQKETQVVPLSDETFRAEESLIISKANRAKKYDYLKNHVRGPTSGFKISKDYGVDSSRSIRSANNSFAGGQNSHFARVPSNLGANSSVNGSINNSSFVTLNNRSIIPQLTAIHRNNRNNSILRTANSSINSTMNDISTLTGFGRGVMEESTPSSSPGPKSANLNKRPLPKSVQQLRDLTAGIKAKYRKS